MREIYQILSQRLIELQRMDGKISQVLSEMAWLAERVGKLKPVNILEIGFQFGGWTYLMSSFFDSKARICAVDMGNKHTKGAGAKVIECINTTDRQAHLIEGNSQSLLVRDVAKSFFGAGYIDLLHIDGNHYYGGVKSDFEMYSPLVRNGLIVLHDIANQKYDVPEFWNEIKGRYKTEEVNHGDVFGIGVIHAGV